MKIKKLSKNVLFVKFAVPFKNEYKIVGCNKFIQQRVS